MLCLYIYIKGVYNLYHILYIIYIGITLDVLRRHEDTIEKFLENLIKIYYNFSSSFLPELSIEIWLRI